MIGVKCPKCALMQMSRPTCKSCGTALNGPAPHPTPTQAFTTPPPVSSPPPPAGPIYMTQEAPPYMAQEAPPYMAQGGPPSMVEDAPPHMAQGGTLYAEPDGDQIHWLTFHGTGGSLFGIQIVNMFLTILTLGIYYFWGKSRVRSYLLSQTEFAGDRFAYHGTGKELLIGFLKAMVLFVPIIALYLAPEFVEVTEVVKIVTILFVYGMMAMLIPLAMVGARRYRMSRTSWRGIRFSFRGGGMDFVKLFAKCSFLSMITGGLYYPYYETRKHAFMVSHSYFGNQKFHFDGHGRDLFGSYMLAMLLALPTLGLYWFWFQAKKHRYFWDNTTIDYARFRSTVTGGALLWLWVGNILLLVVTLGLAWPWVVVRNAQFTARYLTLEGSVDLTAIQQQAQVASPTGEGLASFLDLDSGFDFG